MTPAEIIAMAHEAAPDLTWFAAVEEPREASQEELAFLTRFADLVAAKTLEMKTRDGVVVKPGDKVWVNGSVSVEPTEVKPLVAVTNYTYFGPIPVADSFSTEAAARKARCQR